MLIDHRSARPFLFLRVVVAVGAAIAMTAAPSRAATLTVDNTLDDVDAAVFDGVCATAAGTCTLRAAVQTANALAGADLIVLPAGIYTFAIAGRGEDQAAQGDLDIRDALTIAGADAATTIIDGGGIDRVLDALDVTLEVRDLTIRNGTAPAPARRGGGILAVDSTVLLERTILTQNHAGGGGGIRANGGSLEVRASTIADNEADDGGGGGIYLLAEHTAATCLVTDSTISGNDALTNGGGIFANSVFATATLTVRRAIISGNSAAHGGGIDAASGAVDIDESTIADNSAVLGGGFFTASGTLTLTRSTVEGNAAQDGGGVIAAGPGLIENTTISGNTATNNTGGLTGGGTGLRVRNVTITGNVADSDGDGAGDGGGFSGSNEISNAIVAGNVDLGGEADDCSGTITSGGFNLIERAETCLFVGDVTGNVLGLPAALGPLALNGGPTATHALLAGSPALDAGNPAPPASGATACAAADQRSAARPFAAACDMGAVEATYAISACGNGVLDGGEQCDDGNVRDGDCCTSTCQLATVGSLCTDGDVCTDDACDGAGACVATNNAGACNDGIFCTVGETCSAGACGGGGPRDCDDGIACTSDLCDPTLGCQHTEDNALCADSDPCTTDLCTGPLFGGGDDGCAHFPESGSPCDDGNLCTPTDTCESGTCVGQDKLACADCFSCDPLTGCTILGPEPTCREPTQSGRSKLQLRDAPDNKPDRVNWTWKALDGTTSAEFGVPTGSTTYDLCIYDEASGTPTLVLHATPAVGTCGTAPCWKTKSKSHTYKDRAGAADGLSKIILRSSPPKSRIVVKAKGANLPPLGLPLANDPAVVVQLRNSDGLCWSASFSTPIRNTPEQFKAKSD